MSAGSFFKLHSYYSSFDEDEVQQHSLSEEALRRYMDPDLIPDRSSDTKEEEDTDKEYDKEEEDEDKDKDEDGDE
jgi:hypothetical protein